LTHDFDFGESFRDFDSMMMIFLQRFEPANINLFIPNSAEDQIDYKRIYKYRALSFLIGF
jgi:hypothetical protein